MVKLKTVYVCQQCGAESPRWSGQCQSCSQWNTLVESVIEKEKIGVPAGHARETLALGDVKAESYPRILTTCQEFNVPLGGGIVPGSVILLGGDPGIGKSTLMLSILDSLPPGTPSLYCSGEESLSQIKMRADRMGISGQGIRLVSATDVSDIISTLDETKPAVAIIDSIQTLSDADLTGVPGSVGQVRECASKLITYAKKHHIAIVLIGHVTKEGVVAGPKTLEHMVDTVLYLEGDLVYHYRLLRATKNRFGGLSEIGVFEMTDRGLSEVKNVSNLFLTDQKEHTSGSALTVTIEGTRALMIELQALTVATGFGYPKRTASGFPLTRLQLLIAVLTRRSGARLMEHDVYANVVGGYRVQETGTDLAMCLAVASSLRDTVLPATTVAIGEVSLSGAIRPVSLLENRVKESIKLGMKTVLVPQGQYDTIKRYQDSIAIRAVSTLQEALRSLVSVEG